MQLENLTLAALTRAANEMAPRTGRVVVKGFQTKGKALERVQKCLAELQGADITVDVAEDGAVSFEQPKPVFVEPEVATGITPALQEILDRRTTKLEEPEPVVTEPDMAEKARAAEAARKAKKRGPSGGTKFVDDAVITVLKPDAKKSGGAATRFALLKPGMTVKEFLKAGGARRDIRRGVRKGQLQLGG